MENLLTFYHRKRIGFNCLVIVLFLGFSACQQTQTEAPLYKKEFTPEEHRDLADQLLGGLSNYYQGSVPRRLLIDEAFLHNPESGDVHRELGVPYLKRGMAVEYDKDYSNAVFYDAVNWQGWRGYIYLYFYRDYERAISDFDNLDVLTPNFVDHPQATSIHFMRGISYLKLDKYDEALDYFDQHITEELRTVKEDYIDHKTFLFQGIAHYKKGNKVAAKASFARGTKIEPDNADLWYWTAKLAHEMGDEKNALIALEKAQVQFEKGYENHRPYVEEFFQTYQSDLDELKRAITLLN